MEIFPTNRIDVGGVELNVVDIGEGQPVLLIHGWPDSHTVWRNQIPALVRAGYRVIAPDTRGRGESDIALGTASYKWSILVADMVAVLDALGVDQAQVVGHDWGANIGWQMAIAHPDRIQKFIALSVGHPNAYARGGLSQKLRGWYIYAMQLRGIFEVSVRAFNWWMFRVTVNFPEEIPNWINLLEPPDRLTAAVNYYRANFVDFVFTANNPNVRVPVVGIFSDGDRFLTEGQMKQSERYCDSGFEYFLIEGANHWIQLDAPERVNELILDNLTSVI